MDKNRKNIYLVLAGNIKRYRNMYSLTQEELAEKSNLHPSYIGQIERGTKKISILTLQKISNALNVNISSLLSEDSPKFFSNHTFFGKYYKLYILLEQTPQTQKKQVMELILKLIKLINKKQKKFHY